MSGFRIDVDRAYLAATESLPQLAVALASPATQLTRREALQGGGEHLQSIGALENTYANYTDNLSTRLIDAVTVIDETAQALREIVTLYRRADGQE